MSIMRIYTPEIEPAYHLSFHFYSAQKFSPKLYGMYRLIEAKKIIIVLDLPLQKGQKLVTRAHLVFNPFLNG